MMSCNHGAYIYIPHVHVYTYILYYGVVIWQPSCVSEERVEEVQTMMAASAARSKWMERQRKGTNIHVRILMRYFVCICTYVE